MHTRSTSSLPRMLAFFSLLPICAPGCGSSTGTHGTGIPQDDLGVGRDLASAPDLTLPADDMAQPGQGSYYRYTISKLTLPQTRNSYAIDENGDGRADNQLGNIIGVLASQGLDPQGSVDASLTSGQILELGRLRTQDATLTTDDPVPVVLYAGKAMANPDFSGNGSFTVDNGIAAAPFNGKLVNARFQSESPITTKSPVTLALKIPLFPGGIPVPLVLHGAYVQFDTGGGQTGLAQGQMNGSVKNSDLQGSVIPGIATSLNAQVQKDPMSMQSKQILSIFDTGGCGAAVASDGVIDVCEVAGNSLIKALLAPDVQIYDANGNYAPNPQNTQKDSLSVGISFSAVRAKF